MLPIGYRCKNPGNLRYQMQWNWPGVTGIDDRGFAIFASPEDGIAAWIRQMRRYEKRGKNTLATIIPTYAPAVENNVQAYITAVSKATGIAPDQPLDWNDRKQTIALMKAFTRHELGAPPKDWPAWYDDAVYARGWDKAKPLTQSRTIKGVAGAAASAAVVVADAVVEVATNHTDAIVGAGTAAQALWPKWATLIAAVVGLCFLAWAAYARWSRTKGDEPVEPQE